MTESVKVDATLVSARVETFYVVQREQPRGSGQWAEWSRRAETRDEADRVLVLWSQTYPHYEFRIRRGFKTITTFMED